MNLRDRIGIVHEGIRPSAPDEGWTRCGQTWLTFMPELHWRETRDEVDCMACVESEARARIDVLDGDTIAITVHDEIIVP